MKFELNKIELFLIFIILIIGCFCWFFAGINFEENGVKYILSGEAKFEKNGSVVFKTCDEAQLFFGFENVKLRDCSHLIYVLKKFKELN